MSSDLEAIAVIFHTSSSKQSKIKATTDIFEKAKNCIIKILLRKIFSGSNDVLSVIIAGSENTVNDLASDGDYQNIEVLSEFAYATWEVVEEVSNILPSEIHVNWLDAMVVGIHSIREKIEETEKYVKLKKNITKKKLVILSNFIDDVPDDQVDSVVAGLKDVGVELVVIGPDILKMNDLNDSSTEFDVEKSMTKSQELIVRIFNEVADNGTLCSCDDALQQLQFFNSKASSRMAWNVGMSIGPSIEIPITGYKMLADKQQPIKWQLRSSRVGEEVSVKRNKSFFVGEHEVNRDDIITGYLFGSEIVPFSSNDETAAEYKSGERGLSVLFTVLEEEIPKHLFLGESAYLIVGRKGNELAHVALNAFIQALSESNTVAVARKVYQRDKSVTIGALYPKVDNQQSALIFIPLPFKHQIQKLWFPSLSHVSVTDEQLNSVDKLIDAMDLSNFEDEEDPYHPKKLHDPYEQYLFHSVAARGFNSSTSGTMEIPQFIQDLLLPLPDIVKKSESALEEIKHLFPLEVVKQKTSVKTESNGNVNLKEEVLLKNEDEGLDRNVPDLFYSSVLVVGTVDPESDFNTLLAKGESFEKVSEQMQKVIIELIRRADNLEMLKKPLSSTTLLRSSCIEKKRPDLYNDWMKKLKTVVIDIKQKDLWDKIIKDNLGLITTEEENSSNISTQIAEEFSSYDDPVVTAIKDEEMDLEDMLDEL